MMKFRFDFSLFYSPTQSYGCVTGYVEMPFRPQPGDVLPLLEEDADGGGLVLRVDSVREGGDGDPGTLMLEDHLVDGLASAVALARKLENEGQYYVDVY